MSAPESVRKHLLDLLETFGVGKQLDDLLSDRALQLVFEREFEILGEAMNRLLRDDPTLGAEITSARRIVGLRNILSHGYDRIDDRVLWAAAKDHVPLLKREVDRQLRAGR